MNLSFLKSILAGIFLLCLCQSGNAQERPLGTWRVHLPYSASVGVFDAGDKVYSATPFAAFSYNKTTGEIQTYDKAIGLSDIGIKAAGYDAETNVLALAYNNNNLDLIYNGTEIYNISDIKNEASFGAFNINRISFYGGSAYVSSDIGISVINLSRKEISNTYIIGANGLPVKVNATSVDATKIYAATNQGLKYALLSSSNLQNFASWILFDSTQGLPRKRTTLVAAYNNNLYAVVDGIGTDTLYKYDGSTWTKVYYQTGDTFTSLQVVNNVLYFTAYNPNTFVGKNGKVDAAGVQTVQNVQGHIRPISWFESNGISWEGDEWNGLFKNNQGNVENIVPNGPTALGAVGISVADNKVYVCSGGADDIWAPLFIPNGFYEYSNGFWKNYTSGNTPGIDTLVGFVSSAVIPEMHKAYFASFLYGLFELDLNTGVGRHYNRNNLPSVFELTSGTTRDTRISAIAKDRYNNLWIGNAGAIKPIKLLKSNGEWKEFSVPFGFGLMKKIVIDQNDQLWAPLRNTTSGLLVWSYNGTIDDPSDDVAKVLFAGAGAGNLPDANVYSVAEDKEGNMWVGTEQGIAVFYCPGSVLTSNGCDADQIKVERDGYIGYLFGTESVRAIAVDAANRKWIGTTNGLWLISDDGKKEILKFNTDNSPLPNNQITDIAINDETGEVFIGTASGLVSYQADAMAQCADCKDAIVYPNPVKPDYDGPIAIKGLTENAYVKITDISGTLVYQGKANGSQMIWDGKGYKGNRVKTGVYLVFSSTDLGKERKVAKILLSN